MKFPEYGPDHPLNKLPETVYRGGEFEAKLTFEQRCAVYALAKCNISIAVLAAAFDINRRTVNKIVTEGSRAYKAVRDEFQRLGEKDFVAKYVTENATERVANAQVKPEVKQTAREYDRQTATRRTGASIRATLNAGISMIKHEHHEFTHRVEVSWLEENTAEDDNGPFEHPAGWYWRDLDSDLPDRWQGDPERETHFTSAAALKHAKETI